MDIKDQIADLEKELRFWEQVHAHEAPSSPEFKIAAQIRQLENRDSLGTPRYNGTLFDDELEDDELEDEWNSKPLPKPKTCKHCGTTNLHWVQSGEHWRLYNGSEIHICQDYFKQTKE